jgi:hypothetical protein
MAGKFLTENIDEDAQNRIFNEAIEELETMTWPTN